jgi:hypothetical protein
MLWLFLRHPQQITLQGLVGKWIDIGGGIGGIVKDGGFSCAGTAASGTGSFTGTGRSGVGGGGGVSAVASWVLAEANSHGEGVGVDG